jgi:hypothetical protein
MTRSFSTASVLALVLGGVFACATQEGFPDLDDDGDQGIPPPPPEEEVPALTFRAEVEQIGVGTEQVSHFDLTSIGGADVRMVVADPEIVDVEVDLLDLRLVGLAPGRTEVIAEAADGSGTFDTLEVIVWEVASIDFYFMTRPVAPRPIDRLSGLVGTGDSVRVAFRSADGYGLSGRGTYSVEGPVEIDPYPSTRHSEAFESGERVGLRFAEEGSAVLTASLADGKTASIPIEVIREPARVELASMVRRNGALVATKAADDVLGFHLVKADELVGIDVVGYDVDDAFVAGVTAEWNTGGTTSVLSGEGTSSEIVVWFEEPGFGTVSGTVESDPTLSKSRTFSVAAAQVDSVGDEQ